jgi:hypothetical protein
MQVYACTFDKLIRKMKRFPKTTKLNEHDQDPLRNIMDSNKSSGNKIKIVLTKNIIFSA